MQKPDVEIIGTTLTRRRDYGVKTDIRKLHFKDMNT
jgi:hypothetical protein